MAVEPTLTPAASDATDYAPYSFLAVFAIGAAGLFAFLLVLLGIIAWLAGQPLIEPELLIVALVALLLAFAARRQIANSEGTRVGARLSGIAWWIAVIGGLGYIAYLFGIGFAIRKDAEDAFQRWAASLVKVNPVDPKNVDFAIAFHGTLPPDKQPSVSPNDSARHLALFPQGVLAFRQSDLVRLAFRNGEDLRFDVIGLEERSNEKSGALNCKITIRCLSPEGEGTISLPMQRLLVKGKSEPNWQIVPPQSEDARYFSRMRLTEYGERIRELELTGQQLVYSYFLGAMAMRTHQPRLFDVFGVAHTDPLLALTRLQTESESRAALMGGLGWLAPEPTDSYTAIAKRHFVPLEKGDPVREEEQRKQFARTMRHGVIAARGAILQRTPDANPILVPGEKVWEIRVPVEIQASVADRSQTAARGVVVCAIDDPIFLKELNDLRKNPGALHDADQRREIKTAIPWRIVRVESDMKAQAPPRAPGGPPG